jgi:hypothetical protein
MLPSIRLRTKVSWVRVPPSAPFNPSKIFEILLLLFSNGHLRDAYNVTPFHILTIPPKGLLEDNSDANILDY